MHAGLVFQDLAALTEHADLRLGGSPHRHQSNVAPRGIGPSAAREDVDRVLTGFPGEPVVAFIGDHPGPHTVDGFAVDEHPVADLAEAIVLLDRDVSIGLGPHVEEEIAALGAGFDQQVHHGEAGLVCVGRTVRPLGAQGRGGLERFLHGEPRTFCSVTCSAPLVITVSGLRAHT